MTSHCERCAEFLDQSRFGLVLWPHQQVLCDYCEAELSERGQVQALEQAFAVAKYADPDPTVRVRRFRPGQWRRR